MCRVPREKSPLAPDLAGSSGIWISISSGPWRPRNVTLVDTAGGWLASSFGYHVARTLSALPNPGPLSRANTPQGPEAGITLPTGTAPGFSIADRARPDGELSGASLAPAFACGTAAIRK